MRYGNIILVNLFLFRWCLMSVTGKLMCTVCSVYRTNSLSELLSHIRLFHSHQPSLSIRCGIGGCQRTFRNFGTFQNHISIYHRMEANPTNIVGGGGEDGGNAGGSGGGLVEEDGDGGDDPEGDDSDEDDSDEGEEDDEREDNSNDSNTTPPSDPLRSTAIFLLKLKEGHKLTQAALQGVIDGTTTLWQSQLAEMHTEVCQVLTAAGIGPGSIPGLDDVFDNEGKFGRPFAGLETSYRQIKYCKDHLGLVVSCTYCLLVGAALLCVPSESASTVC